METKEIGHLLITNIETMGDVDTIESIQEFERSDQERIDRQDELKEISRDEWRLGYVPPSSGWSDDILDSTQTSSIIEKVVGMDGIDWLDDKKTS